MADTKGSVLDTIPAVDRAADLLYIIDNSGGTSNKVTINTALGISGDPVGTTDTQTLSAKTLTSPTINGATLSGTLSGTYTIGGTPTFPSTVVSTTGTQTLTNKTLTSPTINTATISNPTLTVNTVSEHTTANGVTVDGLNIKDGKLNTNDSVVTTNITDGSVTIAKTTLIRTQTDNSNSIANALTAGVFFQAGWGQKEGDGSTSMTETVTFPAAFTTVLGVVVSVGSGLVSATPATTISGMVTEFGTTQGITTQWSDVTTTSFLAGIGRSTGTFASGTFYSYSWIAWGV